MRKTLCFVLFSGLIAVNATAQTAKPTAPAAKPVANNPAPVKKGKATPAANQVWVNGKVYHCPGTRYFGNTKKLINNSLNKKPNTPKPNTRNSMIIPNFPAFDSLPKFHTIKPRKITNTVRQIFNAHAENTASSITTPYDSH